MIYNKKIDHSKLDSDGVDKVCDHCGRNFTVMHKRVMRFCSKKCRSGFNQARAQRLRNDLALDFMNSGDIGALSELIVCADLMCQGFTVYRAVSPAARIDLLVMRGSTILSVEVKTGVVYNGSNTVYCPTRENQVSDILAIVYGKDKIEYRPPLPNVNE